MESVRGFKTSRLPPISDVQHLKGCTCSLCDPKQGASKATDNGDNASSTQNRENRAFNNARSYGNNRGGHNGSPHRGNGNHGQKANNFQRNGNNVKAKPAHDKCFLCDKRGHMARDCPDKKRVFAVMNLLSSQENLAITGDNNHQTNELTVETNKSSKNE